MNCLACNSNNILTIKTKVSDFIAERVFGIEQPNVMETNLCRCRDCGFAFYDKRLTEQEELKLYRGYRSDEYQEMRIKSDIWYSSEINSALGNDINGLKSRKLIIERMVKDNIGAQFELALDFGGDQGQKYPDGLEIKERFVYDISGVQTIQGVERIESLEKAKLMGYDFIMCNQVLEHVGDLYGLIETIKSLGTVQTIYYFDVPFDSPFNKKFIHNIRFITNPYFGLAVMLKHFSRIKKEGYFAPMSEHVNFFTPDSLKLFLTRFGFEIIDCKVNQILDVLGQSRIISVLCRLSN